MKFNYNVVIGFKRQWMNTIDVTLFEVQRDADRDRYVKMWNELGLNLRKVIIDFKD